MQRPGSRQHPSRDTRSGRDAEEVEPQEQESGGGGARSNSGNGIRSGSACEGGA